MLIVHKIDDGKKIKTNYKLEFSGVKVYGWKIWVG